MRQNFKRDKMRKEESRRKKQEEKRNKRLHKKDSLTSQSPDLPPDLIGAQDASS